MPVFFKENINLRRAQGVKIETAIPLAAKNFRIQGTQEQNSEILNQVANKDLDWTKESSLADLFVNSPLESSDNSFTINLLDFLTNSMYLQYISLYFSTLATIIFTCKIIMDKNINLEFIKKFIFGKFIYFGITKYISFWHLLRLNYNTGAVGVEVLIFEYIWHCFLIDFLS